MNMDDDFPMWLEWKLQKRKRSKNQRLQAKRLQEEREAETQGQHEAEQRGNTEAAGANPKERPLVETQIAPNLEALC